MKPPRATIRRSEDADVRRHGWRRGPHREMAVERLDERWGLVECGCGAVLTVYCPTLARVLKDAYPPERIERIALWESPWLRMLKRVA